MMFLQLVIINVVLVGCKQYLGLSYLDKRKKRMLGAIKDQYVWIERAKRQATVVAKKPWRNL